MRDTHFTMPLQKLATNLFGLKAMLGVRQAAALLEKAGKLPLMTQGSAIARVRQVLATMPPAELAGVAHAMAHLMPPYAHAEIYDAGAAWLLRLPQDERASVALAASRITDTLRLLRPAYAGEFLALLNTIRALGEPRRQRVIDACCDMQPSWRREIPARVWDRTLRLMSCVPEADLDRFAVEIARLHPNTQTTQRDLEAFLECLEIYVGFEHHDRPA